MRHQTCVNGTSVQPNLSKAIAKRPDRRPVRGSPSWSIK